MNEDKIAEAIEYSAETSLIGDVLSVFLLIIPLLLIVFIFLYVMSCVYPKSKRYRELISDLYITSKIRQIADKEGVNIDSELKVLSKFNTKGKSFDKVLEERLNEKLLEDLEEKKAK